MTLIRRTGILFLAAALIAALCGCGSPEPAYQSHGDVYFSSVLGTTFEYDCISSDSEPGEKYDGLLWLDTSGDSFHLRRYSESMSSWSEESVYTKIIFSSKGVLPGLFIAGDKIELKNEETGESISSKILVVGGSSGYEDFIVIDNPLYENSRTDARFSIYRK